MTVRYKRNSIFFRLTHRHVDEKIHVLQTNIARVSWWPEGEGWCRFRTVSPVGRHFAPRLKTSLTISHYPLTGNRFCKWLFPASTTSEAENSCENEVSQCALCHIIQIVIVCTCRYIHHHFKL